MCGDAVNVVLREQLIVLQVETIEGQRLDMPLPVTALSCLACAATGTLRKGADES